MAREITISVWCDAHLLRDEKVPGEETPPITVDTTTPKLLALCEPCRKELLDPLAELLARAGQVPTPEDLRVVKGAGPEARKSKHAGGCPALACDFVGPNRRVLSEHAEEVHRVTLSVLESGKPPTLYCPEPGCGLGFSNTQGLVAHKRRHEREVS